MIETASPSPRPYFRKGRVCKSCGGPVSDRGRTSHTGEYFCNAARCRLQRDAERQRRYREQQPKLAPLPTREELRRRMLEEGLTQAQVDGILPPSL